MSDRDYVKSELNGRKLVVSLPNFGEYITIVYVDKDGVSQITTTDKAYIYTETEED